MSNILEIDNLTVRFHTQQGVVHAVNGVSLHLLEGETLGIVGESGSGKSVSMLSLLRLIPTPPGRIAGGHAYYKGRDLLALGADDIRKVRGKQIGIVYQDPMTSLNPVLTIGRQLTEVLQLHLGLGSKAARYQAAKLLDMVGIPMPTERLKDYPHQFSGGMRQRIIIAMALACMPRVLIADEPTTSLDVTIQAQIVELVKKLRQELGMAIVWITHDLAVIAGLADRVAVMYAGSVVEEATVGNLFDHPQHPYTLGLLASLPRLDDDQRELVSIEGAPPDMLTLPVGCPFAPRCSYVFDRCQKENPPLLEVGPNQRAACWWDIDRGAPRHV